jgi:ribosomal protein L22
MADPKDTGKAKPASKDAAKPKPKPKAAAAKPKSAAPKPNKGEAKAKPAAKPKAVSSEAKAKAAARATAEPKGKAKAPAKPKSRTRAKPAAKAEPKQPAAPVAPPVVRAKARYVRVAPRKVRLVAEQVRGMQIDEARSLLRFSPRGAAQDLAKLLDSAAANAENNHDLVADDLRITRITVDEGPTLRRYRPRALGRATRIDKRTSHISVALTPEED